MTHAVPHYALYGDAAQPAWLDMVHFEHIHERSSLFDYDIAPHVHDGLIQVLYLSSGGGEVTIDGLRWVARAPALIVVPAGHVHGFRFTPDVDGPVITAAQRALDSLVSVAAPVLLELVRRPLVIDIDPAARHLDAVGPLFEAVAREQRVPATGEAAAGTALLVAIFVQISRLSQTACVEPDRHAPLRSRKAAQVERFRTLVDRDFRVRRPLDDYAAELGISAGQLTRQCRDVLGLSSLEVINARIVHEAERELVYSNLSIKQIAAVLGFADEAYFGRFFRKQTGRPPSEFRQTARDQLRQTDGAG